jgi:DNA-directed RNA polymerase subunit RPC12/RpoP
VKEKIKRILEKIKDIFSLHCPECGGRMKSEYLDMEIDHIVYKCKKCGKEWL